MISICFVDESSPPSRSLAAFLNVTPKSQIALALEKLLILAGLSKSDDHVIKLAMVLCDWLWLWPKATQLSCWILSLFKILTLDGRSAIVAEVISAKAPKVSFKQFRIIEYHSNIVFSSVAHGTIDYPGYASIHCSRLTVSVDNVT